MKIVFVESRGDGERSNFCQARIHVRQCQNAAIQMRINDIGPLYQAVFMVGEKALGMPDARIGSTAP